MHPEEPDSDVQVQNGPETHLEGPVVWPDEPMAPRRKARRGKLTVTSGGSLLAQGPAVVSQGYGVVYNPGMDSPEPMVKSGITTQMLSRNRPSSTEERHRQLFRMTLGVNYEFLPRWSIGTGLSYSILRSDYTTLSGTTETQTTRHMHYLGIPLNLQFRVLEWKRFSVYVNAGPMVETAVGASVKTLSYVSGFLASDQQENRDCRDWRWSVNAGAGVQLRLFRNGALFVQPGISWHIPGNGSVESAYTARPLAFAMDFGFRWTL